MSQRTATGDVQQVAKNMTEELTDPDVAATEFMQFVKKLSTGETAIEGNQVCYVYIHTMYHVLWIHTRTHAFTHACTDTHLHTCIHFNAPRTYTHAYTVHTLLYVFVCVYILSLGNRENL